MKRLFFISALLLSILIGLLGLNLLVFLHTPYSRSVLFTVEPGMTLDQVTDLLFVHRLISNKPLFKFYVLLSGKGTKIRAGEFEVQEKTTPHQLLAMLLKGDFARLRITIPEGWTAREIAQYLGSQGLVDPVEFIKQVNEARLEGSLYPDTYEIYRPRDPEEVIQKMTDRFKQVFAEELAKGQALASGGQAGVLKPEEVVILASIVEKETGRPEERPLIASVFLNRLQKGMALASDPTVIYGIPNFNGNLTRADLERPGPYNTYLNAGLPPTPICNPGREALRAVLQPAQTDSLYFVSRNDGSHEFSRTMEEHGRAVRKYQIQGRQTTPTGVTVPEAPTSRPPPPGN